MGSAVSSTESKDETQGSARAASRQIDRALQKERVAASTVFKILILGGSECGKTTIFKQMRILHLDGFSDEDKCRFRGSIMRNVVDATMQLLNACETFRIVHESSMQERVDRFAQFYNKTSNEVEEIVLPREVVENIQRIWQTKSVQLAYQRRFSYKLLDSAKYFLDSIERISEENYVPTTQDILQCRFRTTGINEIKFAYKKLDFKMVDVGGQRTERRKWIHCFDNVNMVIFVAAMSEYDQADPEDETQNRMIQSQQIFKTVVQSEYFRNASVVLFLNKYDVFEEKIKHSSLRTCWPDYTGDNSVEECTKFMQKQFQRCIPNRQKYFPFLTTATDTNNIELVFSSAVAHIVNQNLRATGLQE